MAEIAVHNLEPETLVRLQEQAVVHGLRARQKSR